MSSLTDIQLRAISCGILEPNTSGQGRHPQAEKVPLRDCLKCMSAVLGMKLARSVLEKRRERTNAMLAKCANEIDSRDTGTDGGAS